MNEWDEQERRHREQEQLEASLYRSRQHGSGLTEEELEEREFRQKFPNFNEVINLLCTGPGSVAVLGINMHVMPRVTMLFFFFTLI